MLISLILSVAFASDACPRCLPEHTAAPNTHPVREIVETPSTTEIEAGLWTELIELSNISVPLKKGGLTVSTRMIGELGSQITMLCTQEEGIMMVCSSVTVRKVGWVLTDDEAMQRASPLREQVERLKLLNGN